MPDKYWNKALTWKRKNKPEILNISPVSLPGAPFLPYAWSFQKTTSAIDKWWPIEQGVWAIAQGVAAHSEYNKLIITRLCQFQSAKKQFIGGLLSDKEFQLLQTQITHALLIILDELDENDLNPLPSNAWNQALQDLALGPMGKLQLVNCDRNEPFNSFASFFQKDSALSHQFYFIAGSPTQKPSSFAERIIYEIVEDKQLLDNDLVVEFEHETVNLGDSQTERVKFHPLPIGLNAASSQLKFKKYFSERMGQNHLPVSLDTFFDSNT